MNGDTHYHHRPFGIFSTSTWLLLCLAFGTPAMAEGPTGPPTSFTGMSYPYDKKWYEGLYSRENRETAVLAANPGIAIRDGDTLTLHLANGKDAVFRNRKPDGPEACDRLGDDCEFLYLAGYLPDYNLYILHSFFYEETEFTTVNISNGEVHTFGDEPIIAPDKLHFFVHSNSSSSFNDYFQVWNISKNGEMSLEADLKDMPTSASFEAFWRDSNTIEVWRTYKCVNDIPNELWAVARRINSKWQAEVYEKGLIFPCKDLQ